MIRLLIVWLINALALIAVLFVLPGIGHDLLEEINDLLSIAYVELSMNKIPEIVLKPVLIPSRIALRAEEVCAHVVVDAINFPAVVGEKRHNFASDETAGSRDNQFFHFTKLFSQRIYV